MSHVIQTLEKSFLQHLRPLGMKRPRPAAGGWTGQAALSEELHILSCVCTMQQWRLRQPAVVGVIFFAEVVLVAQGWNWTVCRQGQRG